MKQAGKQRKEDDKMTSEKTVHGVRHYRKWGYEVRDETHLVGTEKPDRIRMKLAYTPEGDFIGDTRLARRLCAGKGIRPKKRSPDSNVCSIGFSEQDQKWYGWSHRAIFGFAIGAEAKEGDCVTSSGWTQEWLDAHPEDDISLPIGFKAETLDDAKRMAVAFAESVG